MDYSTHHNKKSIGPRTVIDPNGQIRLQSSENYNLIQEELMLEEMKELLALAPPSSWKKTLDDFYQAFVTKNGKEHIPDEANTTERMLALVSFFEEIEKD